MPVFSNILAGAAGQGPAGDYTVGRSLRFNRADSAALNRVNSSAGNLKTWTWSAWLKRSEDTTGVANQNPWAIRVDGNNSQFIRFENATNRIRLYLEIGSSVKYDITTSQRFVDFGAWYHIVYVYDSTVASPSSDRVKLYINGERVTNFSSSSYPSQNQDGLFNTNGESHWLGQRGDGNNYFGGYLADVHFVDGQALAPADFGATNVTTGAWGPIRFSGSHGTNGYHLDFSNNSSDSALGNDAAGSNNFTVANLSSGAVVADQGFQVVKYTGTGSSQAVNCGFEPDFVWIKSRGSSADHELYDSVRGATKRLFSSLNSSETTIATGLTAFTSSGFTVGGHGGSSANNTDYVAWCWKAGGTASQNNNGSITSSVSASSAYGFSVVKFTGNGSGTGTIGHGLTNGAPKWIILKDLTNSYDWLVYTQQIDGSNDYLKLNTTDGKSDSSFAAPTSSVFSYATDSADYIAYCWSEVAGFSKFGSWTGSGVGGSNGPTITLGFRPRYVVFKRADQAGDSWTILDTARDSDVLNIGLYANASDSELTFGNRSIQVSDTGFQVTSTGSSSNASGGKYIYAAFADGSSAVIDSLIDSPMSFDADSGNNPGNYCTWNPHTMNRGTMSDGNLLFYGNGTNTPRVNGTISQSSGKWYYEATVLNDGPGTGSGDVHNSIGWGLDTVVKIESAPNNSSMQHSFYFMDSGWYKNFTGSNTNSNTGKWMTGDVIGVAADLDNNTLTFYKNGTTILNSVTIGTSAGTRLCPALQSNTGNYGRVAVNFGQRAFKYPPGATGGPAATFKSVCTHNFSDPDVANSTTAFDIATYSGNGGNKTVTGLSFKCDLLWIKTRNSPGSGHYHHLLDSVRGTVDGYYRALYANTDEAENTYAAHPTRGGVTAFNDNGFTLAAGTSYAFLNDSSGTYVAWAWDAGTVANPVGDVQQKGAAKYFAIKFPTASGGTVSYGQTTGSVNVELWTSSDNSNWTQQVSSQALATGYTYTTSDRYVLIKNVANSTMTDWYVAATDGSDGHYSGSNHGPSSGGGESWSGPTYTDFTHRRAGGVINTNGSTPCIVRASATQGFSIVQWKNPSSATTLGHGLNAIPSFILAKGLGSCEWQVYHKDIGNNYKLYLNESDAKVSSSMWNSTTPTSTIFNVDDTRTQNFVAYCFAPVEGFSDFGTFSSGSDPFVFTGFAVRYLLMKRTDTAGHWYIYDSKRGTGYNNNDTWLEANGSGADQAHSNGEIRFFSNGFQPIGADIDPGGGTFVYAAFGDSFKHSRAR